MFINHFEMKAFFRFSGGSKSPEMESDEETRTSKKNVKGQSFEGADRVTMEMISTTDVPVERSGQLHNAPDL